MNEWARLERQAERYKKEYYDSYESLDELLDGLDPEDEGMNRGGI